MSLGQHVKNGVDGPFSWMEDSTHSTDPAWRLGACRVKAFYSHSQYGMPLGPSSFLHVLNWTPATDVPQGNSPETQ